MSGPELALLCLRKYGKLHDMAIKCVPARRRGCARCDDPLSGESLRWQRRCRARAPVSERRRSLRAGTTRWAQGWTGGWRSTSTWGTSRSRRIRSARRSTWRAWSAWRSSSPCSTSAATCVTS
eukprot:scaffold6182_cov309-Prasinococcus_capsulatus_cf.AAC.2